MLATIPLDLIENGQRLRDISEATVTALVNSIGDVGLLNPITVYPRKLFRGGNQVDGYGLVAGLHRKTAYERLGLVEIEANVVDLSDLECQIAECDENLVSNQLSASDRARFTKRRKDAYEALHPETKNGVNQHSSLRQVGEPSADRFTADTAAKTGQSERSIQRDAERGAKIAGTVLDLIKGTPLDTASYLDALKAMPVGEQIKAARQHLAEARERERSGLKRASIKQIVAPLDAHEVEMQERATISAAWNKVGAATRQWFLEEYIYSETNAGKAA